MFAFNESFSLRGVNFLQVFLLHEANLHHGVNFLESFSLHGVNFLRVILLQKVNFRRVI